MGFVIRLVGTDLLWPFVGGNEPVVFETVAQAKRKIRYEWARDKRADKEVVPYAQVAKQQMRKNEQHKAP